MKEYKAGIYLRLSKEDTNVNNSINAQRDIALNYAKKNKFDVIKEYADNGWSGILDSRPAFNEMIVDILRKNINMIIVKDLSRLTRDKNKTGYYTEIFFPDNDVRFISVNDYIDSGERYEIDDTIMLRGIVNQSYLQDVSKKIKSVIKDMKEQGKYVQNGAPYGYKKSEADKYKLDIDKKVANNVKLIFDMYLNGYSQGQIAKELTRRGIDTPKKYKGKKVAINEWRNDSISRILKDPTYTGALILNKYETDYLTKKTKKTPREEWRLKENTHKAIIDREVFEEVQKMLEDKFYKPKRHYEYLLKDLVFCGHCKSKMQYKSRTRTKIHNKKIENPEVCWYFKCRMVYKFPSICDKGHTISERNLNEIVLNSLIKRLESINIDEAKSKIRKEYQENNQDYNLLLKSQNMKLKIENNIKKLYNEKLEQNIDAEEFREKYKGLKQQERNIEIEIKKLKEKNKNRISDENLLKIIKDFKSTKDFDNETIKMLIERIEVYEDKTVNIIFNFKKTYWVNKKAPPDGGATGSNGTTEAELNLQITLKVQKLLEQNGTTVILTRSNENAIYDLDAKTLKQKKVSDIKNRVKIGNSSSADIFVSIHLNKIPQQQYYGWQCFYKDKNEQSEKLAKSIQNSLNEAIQKENNRLAMKINNIYIVKNVEIPISIVECGFLSNPQEEQELQQEEYQNRIAWGIYTGICEYFST